MSGYFEPNQSAEDGMFGAGGLNDYVDDEEEEEEEEESEDLSDDEKKKPIAKEVVKSELKDNKKPKDVEGFEKGGDLDKSLKIAKKNAMKNSIPDDKEEEDEDEISEDEDGEIDIDELDLEKID